MKRIFIPMFLLVTVLVSVLSLTSAGAETAVSQQNSKTYLPVITVPDEVGWSMAGANPERTSWTPTEVPGSLKPVWYRPIEAYIPQKVQIIIANGTLFVSTAKGLYTFNADNGAEGWVYPTEMPLGHSPTVTNGVVYVGGFDKKINVWSLDLNLF